MQITKPLAIIITAAVLLGGNAAIAGNVRTGAIIFPIILEDLPEDTQQKIKLSAWFAILKNGSPDDIRKAINDGAEVNVKHPNDQMTPLHWTAKEGEYANVLTLLEYAVAINAQDEHGNTPLHYAVKGKDTRIIRALIKYGANSNLKDKWGNTPEQAARLHLSAILKALKGE